MEKSSARPQSDPIISGEIPPIPEDLANNPDYAQKFPLNGSVKFLDISQDYIGIFKALDINLTRDLFRKEYTYRKLNDDAPISIADNVNAALIKKGLPPLSSTKPDGILYAYYRKDSRSKLTEIEASAISEYLFGPKSRKDLADEKDVPEMLISAKLVSAEKKLKS